MILEPIEILNGILGWIYVILSIIIGVRIIIKYFHEKNIIYIYVGITWAGLSTLWLAASVSFLIFLTTGQLISPILYFLIGVSLIPLFIFIWIMAFSTLVYENYKKIFLLFYGLYGLIFEVFFLIFLFNDSSLIGIMESPINTDWGLFMILYFFSLIITGLITGIMFSLKSINSENLEVKLRGKFLLIAFLAWGIGSIFDAIFEYPLIRTLAVVLLIIASVLWYFAFNLPNFMKKRFL